MFKISQALAQAILDNLAAQPYRNVFQLVEEMKKLEKIEEDKPKE